MTRIAAAFLGGLVALIATWPQGERATRSQDDRVEDSGFRSFAIGELLEQRSASKRRYLSFLKEATMSAGVYHLPKGATDNQRPHALDEVYYVLGGRARFQAGKQKVAVKKGSVLYVRAGLAHRFFEIEEDLSLLVFFSSMPPKRKKKR